MQNRRSDIRAARNGARFTIETDHGLQRPYAVIDSRTGEQVGGRFASRSNAEELRDAENASVRSRSAPQHAYLPNGTRAQRVARIKRYLKGVTRGRTSLRNCGCGGRSSIPNDAAAATTDRDLVGRMINADERAWKEFVRLYDKAVASAIGGVIRLTGRRVASDAETDAKARFYAKLLANNMAVLRQFDSDRGVKLLTWVHTIAANVAKDAVRSSKRGVSGLAATNAIEAMEHRGEDPHSLYVQRERFEKVMRRLSPAEQELVRLYFIEKLSGEETAAELGITPNAVYTRVNRLQKVLEAE